MIEWPRRAWRWPLTPAIAAALCGALELALIVATWRAAFAGAVEVPASIDVPRSEALLLIGGGATTALACVAIHRALAGFRPWLAALAALALFPVLLVGVGTMYGGLLLAGWL